MLPGFRDTLIKTLFTQMRQCFSFITHLKHKIIDGISIFYIKNEYKLSIDPTCP